MSDIDPEGISMLAKLIGAAAAIFGPIGGLWLWIDSRFAKKHSVATQFQVFTNELGNLRSNQAKIFDQMRDMEKVSEARHRELLVLLIEKKGD